MELKIEDIVSPQPVYTIARPDTDEFLMEVANIYKRLDYLIMMLTDNKQTISRALAQQNAAQCHTEEYIFNLTVEKNERT